jgi:hypothetical protein
MTQLRASTDHQRHALMGAVRHALKLCGGGACAEHVTRVNAPVLSKYGSGEHPDAHMPLDVALDIDLHAGEPVLARALAALQGYRLEKETGAGATAPASVLAALGPLASDHGHLVSAIVAAAEDGTLTEAEKVLIRAEAHRLMTSINRILGAL